MKYTIRIIVFFQLLSFSSCQREIKDKIFAKLQLDSAKQDSCILVLNNITDFNWDTVYIVEPSVTLDELNKVLGFYYPFWDDIADRIIFTFERRVVYHEDKFPYSDVPTNEHVYFSFDKDTGDYIKLANKNAIFTAIRSQSYDYITYKLIRK